MPTCRVLHVHASQHEAHCGLHAGHSLGAAVATLVYLYLLVKFPQLRSALLKGGLYTFGCPNVVTCDTDNSARAVQDYFRYLLADK